MYFKESNDFLTSENKKFINEKILGNEFPYFKNPTLATASDKSVFLTHVLLIRPEKRPTKEHINSIYYLDCLEIVKSFFKKFKIKHKEILRLCVNYTYNNGSNKCLVHQDHEFPHKQLIIYLNETDPSSKTIILDKNNKVLKKITPEKNKGVCFDNKPHYHFYPKQGERIVLVATFK